MTSQFAISHLGMAYRECCKELVAVNTSEHYWLLHWLPSFSRQRAAEQTQEPKASLLWVDIVLGENQQLTFKFVTV